MKDKLEFIETKADVEKNMRYLISCRNSNDTAEVKFYDERIKTGANFVVMVIDGQVEFGPSRFVGFKNLHRSDYEPVINPNLSGGATGNKLRRIFGKRQENEVLQNYFHNFLKQNTSTSHKPNRTANFTFFLSDEVLYEIAPYVGQSILPHGVNNEELFALKERFLKQWPISKLKAMSLDEYTNLEKTSFCYWLEAITDDLGSVWGGSAYKFGIFKRSDLKQNKHNKHRQTDGVYSWYGKYGDNRVEVFEKVRTHIVQIGECSVNNDLTSIDEIDLGDAIKWKIAFLYGDFNVSNIFKQDWLLEAAKSLGYKEKGKQISELNAYLINQQADNEFFDFFRNLLPQNRHVLVDVKDEFAEWYIQQPRSNYFNNDADKLIKYLDKSTEKFAENIFECSYENFENIIDLIESTINNNKSVFLKAHGAKDSGKLAAILGKQNYAKFLKEKFGSASNSETELTNEEKDSKWFELKNVINEINDAVSVNKFFDTVKYVLEGIKVSVDDEIIYSSSLNNSIQVTIGSFYVTKLRLNKGKLIMGFYIPRNSLEKLNRKYDLTLDKDEEAGKNKEVIWVETIAADVDITDFLQPITSRAKQINDNQKKSPFRVTWADKNNKWIPVAAVDLEERKLLMNGEEVVFEFDNFSNMKEHNNPTNKILYGPPGTGKTYKLKNEYFLEYVSKETSISKEQHFEKIVKGLHWWEVIALAVKEVGRTKVTQILQNRWVKEKANQSESKNVRATIWGTLQHLTVDECEYVRYNKRHKIQIFNKTKDGFWELVEEQVEEQIPDLFEVIDRVDDFKANPDKDIKRYVFTTFHQSFAYEDFIEGIKPVIKDEGEDGDLEYVIEPGIFMQLCIDAKNDPENQYAIFIDEINRGNVSAIFGELITLIETDKRSGGDNPMSATLPYSKKAFSVPSNVDIYGTMNTADRSVEALDTALRRRFTFEEMMPLPELVAKELGDNNTWNKIQISELLKTINDRITVLVDRDHQIGHSYFLGLKNSTDFEADLKSIFMDKIIPLLQEYFFNDYVKIGMILGDGFVTSSPNSKIQFAKIDDSVDSDYQEGNRYEIISSKNIDLKKALDILMLTGNNE